MRMRGAHGRVKLIGGGHFFETLLEEENNALTKIDHEKKDIDTEVGHEREVQTIVGNQILNLVESVKSKFKEISFKLRVSVSCSVNKSVDHSSFSPLEGLFIIVALSVFVFENLLLDNIVVVFMGFFHQTRLHKVVLSELELSLCG